MRRIISSLLFFVALILILGNFSPAFCFGSLDLSATISATVVDQNFNGPILISPTNDAALNTARPTFSWYRPSPIPPTPLHHYDMYLDGSIFAGDVSDSIVSETYYFYTATGSAGIFYVTPNTDLNQGTHTWKVIAYNSADISASSETRTFYIDSIYPYITITNVDTTTLDWSTLVPAGIPSAENRHITVTTASPLLKGTVEQYANIKYDLICPSGVPGCTSQSATDNSTTGNWEHTFTNIVQNITYTVQISATDAGGNSTFFPDFYIIYSPSTTTPTPTATVTPTPTSTPTISATPTPTKKITTTPSITPTIKISPTSSIFPTPTLSITPSASPSGTVTPPIPPPPPGEITPPPDLLATITPGEYISSAPPAPSIPPAKEPLSGTQTKYLFYLFLLVLVVIGLPLHLLMSSVGTGTPFSQILSFLFVLCFPFFTKKRFQTAPFTFIKIFISDKLDKPWQKVVSDINGYYYLKSPIPESIFLILYCQGRKWKDTLFKGPLMLTTCLYPISITSQTAQEKLRKNIFDLRIIPLIIACLTSITAFIIQPSYFLLVYIYFSLQYSFSEYLYPKIVSRS